MQVTHSDQHRQTTTISGTLLGEQAIKQQHPAHKPGVHLRVLEGVDWRATVSVREREREKPRDVVGVELSIKQKSNDAPTTPVSGQLSH